MGNIFTALLECIASSLDAIYHKKHNDLNCTKEGSKEEIKKDIKEMKESIKKGDELLDEFVKKIKLLSPVKKKNK